MPDDQKFEINPERTEQTVIMTGAEYDEGRDILTVQISGALLREWRGGALLINDINITPAQSTITFAHLRKIKGDQDDANKG